MMEIKDSGIILCMKIQEYLSETFGEYTIVEFNKELPIIDIVNPIYNKSISFPFTGFNGMTYNEYIESIQPHIINWLKN